MRFRKDDYVKMSIPNGDFCFGYVHDVTEKGFHVNICMHDEGDSKIGFDGEHAAAIGEPPTAWDTLLTETEKTIVSLLARSQTTNEIAGSLSLSPATIRSHIRTLRLKLGLEDRAQLVAYSHGLQKVLES